MSRPDYRPRRSVLYMPGTNKRALDKARTLSCDAVILDLEDAVSPQQKEEARRQVKEAVKRGGFGDREVVVRINALDSDWGADDLAAFSDQSPDAILVPKVNTHSDMEHVEQSMKDHGYLDDTALWAMMETPLGVLNAADIAASARLTCLVMGTNDLAKELHLGTPPMRSAFSTSFGLCLLAARAHGLSLLDGVHTDLMDMAGFKAECEEAAQMGFDGKTLIHPKQIEAANAAFRPDEEAINHARRLIDAWKAAQDAGKAVAVVDGKMVEQLHIDEAERLLAIDAALSSDSE